MYSKYNEIEAIVEDLIEKTILEIIGESFNNKKECCIALDMLIEKLTELECDVFNNYFVN